MEGKIVKNISNDYTIKSSDKLYVCKPRGKFRNTKEIPLVGDNVVFDENSNYILEIKKRKNSLVRPSVANIDQVVILASSKSPDFDTNLLDKLLVTIEFNNIKPIICISKIDLLSKDEFKVIDDYKKYYEYIGYNVYYNNDLNIKNIFEDKVTVFTGQSGSGKSSLLNRLNSDFNLKTNEISKALNRGKHTTRHTELFSLEGGLVADTPGFSSLDFSGMTESDIRDNMIEFNKYRGLCKYKDCMHNKEDDCEIKRQVGTNILNSRYLNYLKFIDKKNTF